MEKLIKFIKVPNRRLNILHIGSSNNIDHIAKCLFLRNQYEICDFFNDEIGFLGCCSIDDNKFSFKQYVCFFDDNDFHSRKQIITEKILQRLSLKLIDILE